MTNLTPTQFRLPTVARSGIEIGLNIICRVGRTRPEPERRAMIWCANYAKERNLNVDQLSEELGLSKRDIRSALTDPHEDLSRFMEAIGRVRAAFEAAIPAWVETTPARVAREAVHHAIRRSACVEYVANSRMGKSRSVEREYWRYMDRAIMFECPTGDSERELHESLARELGISCNTGKKSHQVRVQIAACCAPDMISLIIVDEFHRVWPRNPKQTQPKRLEYLRYLYQDGKGASILGIATPQHSNNLLAALENNPRWSPDQWYGRRVPFYAPDTMSKGELEGIARYHAPDFDAPLINALVDQAMACDGFAGLICNTINVARDKAELARSAVTLEILLEAQAAMTRGSRVEQMLKEQAARAQKPAATPSKPVSPLTTPFGRMNGHGHPPAAPVVVGNHTVRV